MLPKQVHYIVLYCITLHYITLHYITLHYITLHYITLHYITLHYITLHYITLHYITLHYITLHYIVYVNMYIKYSLNCLGNKQTRHYLVSLGFCLVLLQLTESHCQGFLCSSPAHLILHPIHQNTSEQSCDAM